MNYTDNVKMINGKAQRLIPFPENRRFCDAPHYKWITLEELEELEDIRQLEVLKRELRTSLPSPRMLNVVDMGVIDIGDELIILKNRHDHKPIKELLTPYNEIQYDMGHKYKEILGENVIFDKELLSRRGKLAIMNYIEYQDSKYCRNCCAKLDKINNEYHESWGACDAHCYAKLVGAL